MSTHPSKRQDLTDAPADAEADAAEGWGDQLLSSQEADGFWGAGTSNPEWVTLQTLLLLHDMGLDSTSEQAREAVGAYFGESYPIAANEPLVTPHTNTSLTPQVRLIRLLATRLSVESVKGGPNEIEGNIQRFNFLDLHRLLM